MTVWKKNGDHPQDGPKDYEGQVVRYYRHPYISGENQCPHCGKLVRDHGWIDSCNSFDPVHGQCVCPGDHVIYGSRTKKYLAMSPGVYSAFVELRENLTTFAKAKPYRAGVIPIDPDRLRGGMIVVVLEVQKDMDEHFQYHGTLGRVLKIKSVCLPYVITGYYSDVLEEEIIVRFDVRVVIFGKPSRTYIRAARYV